MIDAKSSTLEDIEASASTTQSFAGAFLLLLPVVPITATIISIATYIGLYLKTPVFLTGMGWVDTLIPLLVGTGSTLVLWAILARIFYRFTAVNRANEKSYKALINRLSSLNYHLDTLPADKTKEARQYRDAIYLTLKQSGTSWIIGNGYIELWDFMYSAEESLIIAAPQEKVIADAIRDEMCLNDSKITNSEEWVNKLRSAVHVLNPDAESYLKPALGRQSLTAGTGTQQQTPVSNQMANAGTQQQVEARSVLRAVRKTINDFNTRSWDALISARNQIYSTMILVGLTVFALLVLAIIFHVNLLHLEAATFYALIGGLAGLIGRLSIESQSSKMVDDYNLSLARLISTPLLSGLAAVLGVMVVSKTTDLNMIYNFNTSLVPTMIIALTFGLAPNLLINQLQKKSDEYKGNLQSTKPTSGK